MKKRGGGGGGMKPCVHVHKQSGGMLSQKISDTASGAFSGTLH